LRTTITSLTNKHYTPQYDEIYKYKKYFFRKLKSNHISLYWQKIIGEKENLEGNVKVDL